MKKLMFIIGLTFVLFSCEKNYSCKCEFSQIDPTTNLTFSGSEFTTIQPAEATRKNKAEKECADSSYSYDLPGPVTQQKKCSAIVSE